MFEGFFSELRDRGVPVSLGEWMMFQGALDLDLAESSLTGFYYIARAALVKNEVYYDRFDRAFLNWFRDIAPSDDMIKEILEGLDTAELPEMDAVRALLAKNMSLEDVLKSFKEQYEQGHFKGHKGGNKAIGAGGTSVHGAFGFNPAGIRVGQGESRNRSAIQIAEKRSFRNYSSDIILDTRQVRVVLAKLRTLLPQGVADQLDVETTIQKTCRNAGELEFAWKARKKNTVKILLLMDTGGSMTPYAQIVSVLFSAARAQFKDLKHYYFHNCIYDDLWTNIEQNDSVPTLDVLRKLDDDYKVIFVGDASMAPSELLESNGSISYYDYNDTPGVWWLHRISDKFPNAVWLNPESPRYQSRSVTARIIRRIFPMHDLTLDGLDAAVKSLLRPRRTRFTAAEIQSLIHSRFNPYAGSL